MIFIKFNYSAAAVAQNFNDADVASRFFQFGNGKQVFCTFR